MTLEEAFVDILLEDLQRRNENSHSPSLFRPYIAKSSELEAHEVLKQPRKSLDTLSHLQPLQRPPPPKVSLKARTDALSSHAESVRAPTPRRLPVSKLKGMVKGKADLEFQMRCKPWWEPYHKKSLTLYLVCLNSESSSVCLNI